MGASNCGMAHTPAFASIIVVLCLFYGDSASAYLNVNNTTLQHCSGRGMALTGFTRNGQCIDQDDDAGSHHICIEMPKEHNFCEVTRQPNWCGTCMQCMGADADTSDCGGVAGRCPIQNWCVCQWAFASYIQRAGGCDVIDDVVCDATNLVAVNAYRQSSNPAHKEALECILKRCPDTADM